MSTCDCEYKVRNKFTDESKFRLDLKTLLKGRSKFFHQSVIDEPKFWMVDSTYIRMYIHVWWHKSQSYVGPTDSDDLIDK